VRAPSPEQPSDHDLAIRDLGQPAEAGLERDVEDRAIRRGSQDRFANRPQAGSPDPGEEPEEANLTSRHFSNRGGDAIGRRLDPDLVMLGEMIDGKEIVQKPAPIGSALEPSRQEGSRGEDSEACSEPENGRFAAAHPEPAEWANERDRPDEQEDQSGIDEKNARHAARDHSAAIRSRGEAS